MIEPRFAERTGSAADERIAAIRRSIADAIAAGTWRTDPAPREVMPGGVRALAFDPPATPRATLLHFHGGGYRIGCPESVGAFAAALAARAGITVICPAYRLAPEHPLPAALNDAHAVWATLRASGGPVIVSGDSAGGGLAAALTAQVVGQPRPPAALVLLSPWLDLTVEAASYDRNAATDALFSRAAAREAANLYLGGQDARHPHASPLFAVVSAFPPTLICVGDGEVLLDDAIRLDARLRAAARPVTLRVEPAMEHVAAVRDLRLTGAAATFEAVATFLQGVV